MLFTTGLFSKRRERSSPITMYVPWRKLRKAAIVLAMGFVLLLIVYYSRFRRGSLKTNDPYRRQPKMTCPNKSTNEHETAIRYVCEEILPFDKSHHDQSREFISTFDLPEVTNYAVGDDGKYSIPDEFYKPEVGKSGNDEDLHVILIPFSHVDAGYGQTMEDYHNIFTQTILDLMLDKLGNNTEMRFQWAETVFLEKWFSGLPDHKKTRVRELVSRGQLDVVLGGWVMVDEALTQYSAVIDQLIEGHQWLVENLHVQPRNAWINDPFGYSSTMPYLWKMSGIENMVVLRVHQAVKNRLMRKRSLDFLWRPYWNRDEMSNDILCNVMPYESYFSACGAQSNVCKQYEYIHMHSSKSKAVAVDERNVHMLAKRLNESFAFTAKMSRFNTIPVFIGEDNSFNDPRSWDSVYKNYAKLIRHVNAIPQFRMHMKFGTLSDYFSRVREMEKRRRTKDKLFRTQASFDSQPDQEEKYSESVLGNSFPVISGDFFPYSDTNNTYWTGFYSNRPWLKRFSREVEAIQKAAEIFAVIAHNKLLKMKAYINQTTTAANFFQSVSQDLQVARRNVALYQHHDGTAGTSYPHVVRDYEKRLLSARQLCNNVLKMALCALLSGDTDNAQTLQENFIRKSGREIAKENVFNILLGKLGILVVNALLKRRTGVVQIAANDPKALLKDSLTGNIIPIQAVKQQFGKDYNLYFTITLAPLEIRRLTLVQYNDNKNNSKTRFYKYVQQLSRSTQRLENQYITADIDANTGSLTKLCDLTRVQAACIRVKTEFLQYTSNQSGAYVFKADSEARQIDWVSTTPEIFVMNGPIMSEVQVVYNQQRDIVQTFRVYKHAGALGQGVHISNKIQIPSKLPNNVELVMRITTDIDNDGSFFTDQNGFTLIGRKVHGKLPIEGNYYPMTSMAILEDGTKRLTLHSGQSHGVTSLDNGQLEVMLERVVGHDDGKGLGHGITDKIIASTEFFLQLEHKESTEPVIEPRYTKPSYNAMLLNEYFQNQLVAFSMSHEVSKEFEPSFSPLHKTNVPCAMSIVNVRNLVTNDLSFNGTSMVVHRKSAHCMFPPKDLLCQTNSDKFNVHDLLLAIGADEIAGLLEETSLTHLTTVKLLKTCDNVVPDVNELRAFVFRQCAYKSSLKYCVYKNRDYILPLP